MNTYSIQYYSGYEKELYPHNFYETTRLAATAGDAVWTFQKERLAETALCQSDFYKRPVIYSVEEISDRHAPV